MDSTKILDNINHLVFADTKCRVCGKFDKHNIIYSVPELNHRFGKGSYFSYFQCTSCGLLQIKKPPLNISNYYQSTYYSLKQAGVNSTFFKYLMKKNVVFILEKKGFLNHLINLLINFIVTDYALNSISYLYQKNEITKDSIILDVGGGSGELLKKLKLVGFKKLFGIDKFIEKDVIDENINIRKGDFIDLSKNTPKTFDLIMFHHSFEHVYEQEKVLKVAKRLLKDNGIILIRIPVSSSFAWFRYKTNWSQIDAPRHFFLHSYKSLQILIDKTGLRIINIYNDSNSYQFTISQNYEDKKFNTPHSFVYILFNFILHSLSLKKRRYQFFSNELNKAMLGDQAVIYLKKE